MIGLRRPLGYLAAAAVLSALLAGCGRSDAPDDLADAPLGEHIARVLPAAEILSGANIPTLDPHSMAEAEIEKVLGSAPYCTFHYTSAGKPVLGISQGAAEEAGAAGVVKLDGDLVALEQEPAESALRLVAEPIRFSLAADEETTLVAPGKRDATLIFEIGEELRVGYRGYFHCGE